jgi:hypothetical protein
MKVQRDEDGGRTLLSDNTGGGEVVLWPITFLNVGFWISTWLSLMYIYSWLYVYSIPTSAKCNLRRTFRWVTTA